MSYFNYAYSSLSPQELINDKLLVYKNRNQIVVFVKSISIGVWRFIGTYFLISLLLDNKLSTVNKDTNPFCSPVIVLKKISKSQLEFSNRPQSITGVIELRINSVDRNTDESLQSHWDVDINVDCRFNIRVGF